MSRDAIINARSVLFAAAAATIAPVATAAALAGLQTEQVRDWRMHSVATSTVQPGRPALAADSAARMVVAQAVTGPYPPLGYDPGGPGSEQAATTAEPAPAAAAPVAPDAASATARAPQRPQPSSYPPQGAAPVYAPYPPQPYWGTPQQPSQWQGYPLPPQYPGYGVPPQAVPAAPTQQPAAGQAQPGAPTPPQTNAAIQPAPPQMAPAWQQRQQRTWQQPQQGTWQQPTWQTPPPPPPGYGYPGWGAAPPPPAPYQPSTWSAPHSVAPVPAQPKAQPAATMPATETPAAAGNPQPAYFTGTGPTGAIDGQAGFALNGGFAVGGNTGAGSPWTHAPPIMPAGLGNEPGAALSPQPSAVPRSIAPTTVAPASAATGAEHEPRADAIAAGALVPAQPNSIYPPSGYLQEQPSWGGVLVNPSAPASAGTANAQ